MRNTHPHVVAAFYGTAWAILPEKLAEIETVLLARMAKGPMEPDERDRAKAEFGDSNDKAEKHYTLSGVAAVVPIHGTISPRASVMAEWSGGTTSEGLGRAVDAAVADTRVEAIVLDINSPGGSVAGLPEAAAKIFAARKVKPVFAVANHMAASAAYWLGSQASEFTVSPSAEVGSIGVIWAHRDHSKFTEQMGVSTTYVTAGKYKTEGAPEFPLDPEARAEMQRIVDAYYEQFVTAVAKGRGVSTTKVIDKFKQGRMALAGESVELGMADRIATLEQVVNEVNASRNAKTKRRVAADLANAGLPTF